MLGGNVKRLRLVDQFLTLAVSVGMIFGTFAIAGTPTAHAVTNTATFEVGSQEPGSGSLDALINGANDWDDLSVFTTGTLDPGEVLIINDTGYTGPMTVLSPADVATLDANCPNINNDDIIKGGTKIDDYPFVIVEGSVPGKVDLCQVYVSYGVDANGDTILYMGALRREATGTVAVALELNKVADSRSVDDLLVSFEFDGSGPIAEINVRRWTGSAWQLVNGVSSDGSSWEHFGEIWVNLSDSDLLPPPGTADDCDSFSTVFPYGFRGDSDQSQVGDALDPAAVTIPRCGELTIIKDATPASGTLEFGWELSDNSGTFDTLTGDIQDGESITMELVAGSYNLVESIVPAPYQFDRIECSGGVDPSNINIDTSTSVTCTIYNQASSLVVTKVGEGDSAADFTFSATGQSDFDLSLGESSETFIYTPGTTVNVSEALPAGNPAWSSEGAVCTDSEGTELATSDNASISVDTIAGELVTCVFTNTQDGTVTVVKEVVNDHGGDLEVGDFPLFLNGDPVTSGTPNYVPTGNYTASETNQAGYTASGPVCLDDDTGANVGHPFDLGHGQSVTCTITNNDDPGTLTLLKNVDSQNGGQAADTAWTLHADGPVSTSGSEGDASVTSFVVPAGSYDLSETGGPSGWIQSGDWNCFGADMSDGDTVNVGLGEDVTCEVTNTDIAPQLTLVKDVQNNNGGNADTNDFTLTADGPVTISGVTGHTNVTNAEVLSGSYDLSEEGPLGYVQVGDWVCVGGNQTDGDTVDLGPGDVATCTVTNQDVAPGLTVTKVVNNSNGGDAVAADFQLRVNGSAVDQDTPVPGVVANTEYTVTEDQLAGYTQVGDVVCVDDDTQQAVAHPVTLNEGQSVTCTITNTDIAPALTLVKEVQNDNGGDAVAGDFQLTLNGGNTNQGAQTGIESNTSYEVGEIQIDGYTQVGDVVCVDDDTQQAVAHPVTLNEGQSVTCTITNTDIAPALTLVKEVQNDNGGDAVAGDFQLTLNGGNTNQGAQTRIESNTSYEVGEIQIDGYTQVGDVVCVDDDTQQAVAHPVTLNEGQSVTCTITNTDIAPDLTVVKVVINDNGGDAEVADFDLFVNGDPATSGVSHPGIEANTEYTVTENQLPGYFQVGDVVCVDDDTQQAVAHPVTLNEGQSVTCTITNNDQPPGLIVIKEVQNNFGGDAVPADFQLYVNGSAANQGEPLDVVAGVEYTVTEDQLPGYIQVGDVVCEDSNGAVAHPVTLDPGQAVTCTITNEDLAPSLSLVKVVINDDGGDATPGDFVLTLNGGDTNQGAQSGILANTEYTVGENALDGYTQVGEVVCVDDDTQEAVAHPVTLNEGQSVTCTITNDDDAPGLTLLKEVINDDGGDAVPADFQLRFNGEAAEQAVVLDVDANTEYTVTEDQLPGYIQVGDVVCVDDDTQEAVAHPVTLNEGQSVTCTITNDDEAPALTLVKVVINDDGGDATPGDFQLTLNGGDTNQGAQSGILANTEYTVGENLFAGYLQLGEVVCVDDDTQDAVAHAVTLNEGQSVTCTITNDDAAPGLIVIKEVINDDGGNAESGDFQLRVNGDAVEQGIALDVDANTEYTVTEDQLPGYTQTNLECVFSGTADEVAHPVSLAEGESVTCTITNDDDPAQLILNKVVINDDAGEAVPADFQLTLNGENAGQGVAIEVDANTVYTVGEEQLQGYTQEGVVECVDNATDEALAHPVTLTNGQSATCTITNNDIPDEVLDLEILPFTGANSGEMALVALMMMIFGSLVVLSTRREEEGLDG